MEVQCQVIVVTGERDRPRILVGNDAKLLDILYRLSPRSAAAWMMREMLPQGPSK